MHISHRYKFIFFSFPKTGSESVRALLDPYSDIRGIPFWERDGDNPFYSHISPAEVKALFEERGWNYEEYYKFTFVRNPWARLVSLYNMIYFTRAPRSLTGKVRAAIRRFTSPSFKQWLKKTRTDGDGAGGPPDQRWQVYGTYSIESYTRDDDGKPLVDEVLKLEEIDSTLPVLLKRIGIPDADSLHVPRVNTRRARDYSDYYDAETIELVAQRYRYDIEHFDYHYQDIT